jgi:transposase-like protein
MSPDKSRANDQDPSPFCPQCGSDDTKRLPNEPPAEGDEPPDPKAKVPSRYRCLTCRYKWKEEE